MVNDEDEPVEADKEVRIPKWAAEELVEEGEVVLENSDSSPLRPSVIKYVTYEQ